jgi:two-component system, NarL family, sensor histidine kinase DevS
VEDVAGHHVELTDQLFISVIDAAPDGIVVVDDQGVIALANPMAAQMFGYSADELVGQPIEVLLQRLFAVGLSLQGASGGSSLLRVTERVEGAIDEIDGTVRDIRTSIFSLHARRMPTAGLRDDVLATAREAGRALAFEPHVVFDGPIDAATPDSVREHLVPTLREALSNVVKHASASHVSVPLTIASGELLLQVVDDGIGVPAGGAHGGRGLGNMTERALALGGRCEIRPGDGGGTLFEWHVPLKSRA